MTQVNHKHDVSNTHPNSKGNTHYCYDYTILYCNAKTSCKLKSGQTHAKKRQINMNAAQYYTFKGIFTKV